MAAPLGDVFLSEQLFFLLEDGLLFFSKVGAAGFTIRKHVLVAFSLLEMVLQMTGVVKFDQLTRLQKVLRSCAHCLRKLFENAHRLFTLNCFLQFAHRIECFRETFDCLSQVLRLLIYVFSASDKLCEDLAVSVDECLHLVNEDHRVLEWLDANLTRLSDKSFQIGAGVLHFFLLFDAILPGLAAWQVKKEQEGARCFDFLDTAQCLQKSLEAKFPLDQHLVNEVLVGLGQWWNQHIRELLSHQLAERVEVSILALYFGLFLARTISLNLELSEVRTEETSLLLAEDGDLDRDFLKIDTGGVLLNRNTLDGVLLIHILPVLIDSVLLVAEVLDCRNQIFKGPIVNVHAILFALLHVLSEGHRIILLKHNVLVKVILLLEARLLLGLLELFVDLV